MKIFRRSPPNREIEFTWHREREGGRGRKEDRHWPPYLSIIIARHIALDLFQRVIPFLVTSPRSGRASSFIYLANVRVQVSARLRPDCNAGKDIPGVTRFEAPEINRPRSFSF